MFPVLPEYSGVVQFLSPGAVVFFLLAGILFLPATDAALVEFAFLCGRPEVADEAGRLPVGPRVILLEKTGRECPASAVERAASAAVRIADSDGRIPALRGVLRRWAAGRGEDAIRFAVAARIDDSRRSELIHAVYEGWAEADPGAAARSFHSLGQRWVQSALSGLLRVWASGRPAEAAVWAGSLPGCHGGRQDSPVGVESMAGFSWVTGMRLCREDVMKAVAWYWARTDESAVRAWARSQSEALRTELDEFIRQGASRRGSTSIRRNG